MWAASELRKLSSAKTCHQESNVPTIHPIGICLELLAAFACASGDNQYVAAVPTSPTVFRLL